MRKIAALVGIAAIVALLAYTYYAFAQAQYTQSIPPGGMQPSISVNGEGEVLARPDVATFSFSVTAKENTASVAQQKSAEATNAIMEYLKGKGIEDRDIKTQYYNLNPRYEYPDTRCTEWSCPPVGEPKLIGYEVTQSIEVKVRTIDDAGMLIAGVGELGATNVSGLTFTIDDEETLRGQAREAAIEDAKEKMQKLESELGVKVVRIVSFYEEGNDYYPYYGYGMGGAMAESASYDAMKSAPIPTGENTITSRVSITYEVR